MKKLSCLLFLVLFTACGGHRTPTDGDPSLPRVFFVSPVNGEKVINPVFMQFGTTNFVLESPGVAREGHGYLVLGLNVDCLQVGELFPFDERYVHIQNGTAEAILELTIGEHVICLQASDGEHRATSLVQKIRIEVVD